MCSAMYISVTRAEKLRFRGYSQPQPRLPSLSEVISVTRRHHVLLWDLELASVTTAFDQSSRKPQTRRPVSAVDNRYCRNLGPSGKLWKPEISGGKFFSFVDALPPRIASLL
ncbi:hypothetical protein TMatcc_006089 [Talaromyces marneffei ATCC 18224]